AATCSPSPPGGWSPTSGPPPPTSICAPRAWRCSSSRGTSWAGAGAAHAACAAPSRAAETGSAPGRRGRVGGRLQLLRELVQPLAQRALRQQLLGAELREPLAQAEAVLAQQGHAALVAGRADGDHVVVVELLAGPAQQRDAGLRRVALARP